MTHDAQRLADYLAHILEAIERIEHYVSDMDEIAFLGNQLVQDAVIRNFEIIVRPATTSKNASRNSWPQTWSCRWSRRTRCAMS